MSTAPADAREALDMVRAGLGYLAAADAAQLSAATQAECLRGLERAGSVLTAARASMLAGFTAGKGYADDAAYSARSWLIHQTHITSGAAVGHTAWAKRAATHPRVLAALAAEQVSESVARLICLWTNRLPEKFRDESEIDNDRGQVEVQRALADSFDLQLSPASGCGLRFGGQKPGVEARGSPAAA